MKITELQWYSLKKWNYHMRDIIQLKIYYGLIKKGVKKIWQYGNFSAILYL